MDRFRLKQKELEFFVGEYKINPQLFTRKTFYENPQYLKKFGIHIPNKEKLPNGFLKFFPQDFIVEEVSQTGQVYTIDLPEEKQEPKVTGEGDTFYATLVKCGMGTLEAIEDIAKQLKCDVKQVAYAGIKDKDALTAQRISFRHVPLADIEQINSKYYFLKDIEQGKGAVEKGGLLGNKFTVFMRTEQSLLEAQEDKSFLENVQHIFDHGFYNYFYLQRFGTPRLQSHQLGYTIMRGQYEAVVKMFLFQSTDGEMPYIGEMRRRLGKMFPDFTRILEEYKKLPIIFGNEIKIVEYLIKNPNDYAGALGAIIEQVEMWVYAFSSWLFNYKLAALIQQKKRPPALLPLFLSFDRKDWGIYEKLLQANGLFPPPFANLKPFPKIQMRHRDVKTIESADIKRCEIMDNGIIISFTLGKGEYATTFLSHLFNMISGLPPEKIVDVPVDSKAILGEGTTLKTAQYFSEIIKPKSQNIIEEMAKE
ncbi:MAG: tRNA pseudouridine(13) synthase TruD [Candidatus Paceibacterota bacterium]